MTPTPPDITVYATCPPSNVVPRADYLRTVADAARWSEAHGCHGMLVYTDNGLVDPWLLSQVILQQTERLCPLVAVQPIYMHPYAVAKNVATLAHLHGRRVDLNMLAGGFKNDLEALGDTTPHDDRYLRTTEYTRVVMGLLREPNGVSLQGRYYQVDKLKLKPAMPPELLPGVLISGSSPAGLQAARELCATAVRYPKRGKDYLDMPPDGGGPAGIRVGIVARDSDGDAWDVAERRFPADRRGQLTHELAMKVSDSHWHRQLSELGQQTREQEAREQEGRGQRGERSPYWLHPFENYKTFCPYLVGSHATVAAEIADYLRAGFRTFILDVPASEQDLEHVGRAFAEARVKVKASA